MKYWLVHNVYDGEPWDYDGTYFTNYASACTVFEALLDDAADYGNAVSLIECEDDNGIIRQKSTIKEIKAYEDVSVMVIHHCLRKKRRFRAAAKLSDVIKEVRKEFPGGTILINGARLSDDMMQKRLFELVKFDNVVVLTSFRSLA